MFGKLDNISGGLINALVSTSMRSIWYPFTSTHYATSTEFLKIIFYDSNKLLISQFAYMTNITFPSLYVKPCNKSMYIASFFVDYRITRDSGLENSANCFVFICYTGDK